MDYENRGVSKDAKYDPERERRERQEDQREAQERLAETDPSQLSQRLVEAADDVARTFQDESNELVTSYAETHGGEQVPGMDAFPKAVVAARRVLDTTTGNILGNEKVQRPVEDDPKKQAERVQYFEDSISSELNTVHAIPDELNSTIETIASYNEQFVSRTVHNDQFAGTEFARDSIKVNQELTDAFNLHKQENERIGAQMKKEVFELFQRAHQNPEGFSAEDFAHELNAIMQEAAAEYSQAAHKVERKMNEVAIDHELPRVLIQMLEQSTEQISAAMKRNFAKLQSLQRSIKDVSKELQKQVESDEYASTIERPMHAFDYERVRSINGQAPETGKEVVSNSAERAPATFIVETENQSLAFEWEKRIQAGLIDGAVIQIPGPRTTFRLEANRQLLPWMHKESTAAIAQLTREYGALYKADLDQAGIDMDVLADEKLLQDFLNSEGRNRNMAG